MRYLALMLCLACGREPLPNLTLTPSPSAVTTAADTSTVRLYANFDSGNDMFRFSDTAILTETTTDGIRVVKASDGTVVDGPSARFDLKASLARSLIISNVLTDGTCQTAGPVPSLAQVDPLTCTGWRLHTFIHPSTSRIESAVGRGFIVKTRSDGVYKLWVVENGRDARGDFVQFQYAPVAPICPQEAGEQPCLTTQECCNRRHTCTAGVCQY